MKKCLNCNKVIKDNDLYCRNCGIRIRSKLYYILIDVLSFVFTCLLIFIILILIASYFVY